MKFAREILSPDALRADPAAVCAMLAAGTWGIEAGCNPPDWHDPARLLHGAGHRRGIALSLTTEAVIRSEFGPALTDRLRTFDLALEPLFGLALHELLVNGAVHGNLDVGSHRLDNWHDVAARQAAIARAAGDPARAGRCVSIAIGWRSDRLSALIADEGDGYDFTARPAKPQSAWRGLQLARKVGQVEVGCSGRLTGITLACRSAAEGREP